MYRNQHIGTAPWRGADPASQPRHSGPLHADVAIIGGGLTGLSTAWHLAQLDPTLSVVLLEASRVGDGASNRAAGNCLDLVGEGVEQLVSQFGRSGAVQALEYGRAALRYVEAQADELDIPYTAPRADFIEVAVSPSQVRALERRLALLTEFGFREGRTWMDAEQCRQRFPTSPFLAGIRSRNAKLCDPDQVIKRWRTLVLETQVRIFESTPAQRIERRGTTFAITTPSGQITAERVVLAANAFTDGGLDPSMARLQRSIWTYCIATEPISAHTLKRLGLDDKTSLYDANHLLHYFRCTAEGRLLFGGGRPGIEKSKPATLASHKAFLERQLRRYFPSLANVRTEFAWCGPISITPDLSPGIGSFHQGRFLVAVGCIGHGLVSSQYNGKLIATALSGAQEGPAAFPFRTLKRWPGLGLDTVALHAMRFFFSAKDSWNADAK